MAGETDLTNLLRSIEPELHPDEFVFCTTADPSTIPESICTFREREGVALICRRADAEAQGLSFTFPCRMITLNVHSSLEAIGFLAAISMALASRGIGANVVSAFYHDHLFVASDQADAAMAVLRDLQKMALDRQL